MHFVVQVFFSALLWLVSPPCCVQRITTRGVVRFVTYGSRQKQQLVFACCLGLLVLLSEYHNQTLSALSNQEADKTSRSLLAGVFCVVLLLCRLLQLGAVRFLTTSRDEKERRSFSPVVCRGSSSIHNVKARGRHVRFSVIK